MDAHCAPGRPLPSASSRLLSPIWRYLCSRSPAAHVATSCSSMKNSSSASRWPNAEPHLVERTREAGMDQVIGNTVWWDAGLAGVQWLLLDPQPQAMLRNTFAALLPDASLLGDYHLHRAKYKPGRRLTTYYAVTVRDGTIGAEQVRQIEVNWR